jgi:hypothetical protein
MDIKKRLAAVLVFPITDDEGKPCLTEASESKRVSMFYLDPQEAARESISNCEIPGV